MFSEERKHEGSNIVAKKSNEKIITFFFIFIGILLMFFTKIEGTKVQNKTAWWHFKIFCKKIFMKKICKKTINRGDSYFLKTLPLPKNNVFDKNEILIIFVKIFHRFQWSFTSILLP